MIKYFINNTNITKYVITSNFTNDLNYGNFGTVTDNILNQVVVLNLSINFKDLFLVELNDLMLRIEKDDNIVFEGLLDNFDNNSVYCILTFKSYISLLFNRIIKNYYNLYTIDNTYPVVIINDLLDLVFNGKIRLNEDNYKEQLQFEKNTDMFFYVTSDNISAYDVISQLCEKTCSIFYQKNNEFYFEHYDTISSAYFKLDEKKLFNYQITKENAYSEKIKPVQVKFGYNTLARDTFYEYSKTIDMSSDSDVYCYILSVAELIASDYDELNEKKDKINFSIGNDYFNVLNKCNVRVIEFKDKHYFITSIKDSNSKYDIEAYEI